MTKIEQDYVEQGYTLPTGYTWELVARERVRYTIGEFYVPLALGPGCCAWGTPMVDGKFMAHD